MSKQQRHIFGEMLMVALECQNVLAFLLHLENKREFKIPHKNISSETHSP